MRSAEAKAYDRIWYLKNKFRLAKLSALRYQKNRLNPEFLAKRNAYKKKWEAAHTYSTWEPKKRACQKDYQKRRLQILAKSAIVYREGKQKIKDYLLQHSCVDCGMADPRCLDFDHVRGEKSFTIGKARNCKWEKIVEEIAKCDIRCANCHRIRHYGN